MSVLPSPKIPLPIMPRPGHPHHLSTASKERLQHTILPRQTRPEIVNSTRSTRDRPNTHSQQTTAKIYTKTPERHGPPPVTRPQKMQSSEQQTKSHHMAHDNARHVSRDELFESAERKKSSRRVRFNDEERTVPHPILG